MYHLPYATVGAEQVLTIAAPTLAQAKAKRDRQMAIAKAQLPRTCTTDPFADPRYQKSAGGWTLLGKKVMLTQIQFADGFTVYGPL